MGKKSSKKGGGGRKIGRKAKDLSFQRYKSSGRFMRGIKQHVHNNPNDRPAASVLERMKDAGSWGRWREVRRRKAA